MERQRIAEASKGVGRPKVGGEFELLDQEGQPFGDREMKGGFSLVSAYPIYGSIEARFGKGNTMARPLRVLVKRGQE